MSGGGGLERVSRTCGFLGSSLASSFLPLQLFFGTWQNAHLNSCLRSGSVELQVGREAESGQRDNVDKRQCKRVGMTTVHLVVACGAQSTFDVVND